MGTDLGLGLKQVSSGGAIPAVDMLITLLNCETEKDVMEMEPMDRIKYATERKDYAAKYFKQERYSAAFYKYKMVDDLLEYADDIKDNKIVEEVKSMRRTTKLNQAACGLK